MSLPKAEAGRTTKKGKKDHTNLPASPPPDLSDGRTEKMYGAHDEKLVSLKLKYHPANVFNKWGDVTAQAVEQNHAYNTMNLKPRQIAVE